MKLRITNPGVLSTVQDKGRYGYMKAGVRTAGVMDSESYRAANAILENDANAAVLEMTLMGITAVIEEDGCFVLTGAEMGGALDGKPLERNQVIHAHTGQTLSMGMAVSGCRSYLAIEGGIDVPSVMGSRSTDVKCGIGGYQGRALLAGDLLYSERNETKKLTAELSVDGKKHFGQAAGQPTGQAALEANGQAAGQDAGREKTHQKEAYRKKPVSYGTSAIVRVVEGPQADWFSEEERRHFFHGTYEVTNESDRMGMRLKGRPVKSIHGVDIVSDGIAFGSIQITKSGMPIIMMADHQTTGGYAKIGTVCSFDLPKLAQLRPGNQVSFQQITVEEAQYLYCHPEERNRTAPLSLPNRKGEREGKRHHRFQKLLYHYRHG